MRRLTRHRRINLLISRNMRVLRKDAGVTLEAIGEAFGVSRQAVFQWEQSHNWTPESIERYVSAITRPETA